ncbi:DUF3658 domain-containing protein [Herbaspirillum autotrophicum]|uniref:DUF3658 domain-containing protein n=1 Tax=Herbaspirillum autotrophicum TaxID=180195 RepID=UPI00067D7420|nr:DUF3658 domain-containing protein [Herbaspirillum autotrophicum]
MHEFHLTDNASTAGSLRVAFPHARVFCAHDDYSLGPLRDGNKRAEFWRGIDHGYAEPEERPATDPFQCWRDLQTELSTLESCKLFIWHSGSGAEYMFLRVACHWLANTVHPLFAVEAPPRRGRYATAEWPPSGLKRFVRDAVSIAATQRQTWACECEAIAQRPELLRICDAHGKLLFRDLSEHDHLLLAACTRQWQLAGIVVGQAMANADPRNSLGDAFLRYRLLHFVDTGLLEVDDARCELQTCYVRLI